MKEATDSLRCVIIDDEKKDRENLRLLLENYCPEVTIIGEGGDAQTIEKLLTELQPDLVFLDIQIGPKSIFDIINGLNTINFKIVFVTAYDQYAIKGYQYDAIDYLLKPVDKDKLQAVVQKTLKIKEDTRLQNSFLREFKEIYSKVMDNPKISVSDSKGVHILKVDTILYCSSEGNYTTFFLSDEREIIVSKNLKYFEGKLKDFKFLRVHKSYLINVNYVDFVVKEQGGAVILKNGTSVPITRNAKKELITKMNLY